MASIVDSFREVFSDRLSFLKIFVLAIPVYYSYQVYLEPKRDFTGFFWIAGITSFFLFGFLVEVANNVINETDKILPALDPLKLGFSAVKGLLAIGPAALISCLPANYICSLINISPGIDVTLKSIIWLVAAAIIIISFLLFSTNKKISDAYNFKIIYQKSGDLITSIIFFIIQLVVINLPTNGFIGYILFVLFGYGLIFIFFLALALVFNIAVTGHYMAQINYEVLTYDKDNSN